MEVVSCLESSLTRKSGLSRHDHDVGFVLKLGGDINLCGPNWK